MAEPPPGTERYVGRTLNEHLIKTATGRRIMESDPSGSEPDGPEYVDAEDALQAAWFLSLGLRDVVRALGHEIDDLRGRLTALETHIGD